MLAVCKESLYTTVRAWLTSADAAFSPGLYYKLHGRDRPVGMKKSIIKRRKRVVPALRDQSPTAGSSYGSSASPETIPVGLAHTVDDHHRYELPGGYATSNGQISPHIYQPSRVAAPPPVDFTNYGSSNIVTLPHHPPPPQQQQPHNVFDNARPIQSEQLPGGSRPLPSINHPSNPKKRALPDSESSTLPESRPSIPTSAHLPPINPAGASSSSNPARLSSISSLLNHTDRAHENSRIDPALTTHNPMQQQHQHQHHAPRSFSPSRPSASASPTPAFSQPHTANVQESEQVKAGRRAQLQREAENMREALRAKERELAELAMI